MGLSIIFRQLLVLVLPAAGYGTLLWLLAGRPALWRRQAWLWFGFGGLAAHALLLQNLVYLQLPLRLTAWPALLVGMGGLAAAVGLGWKKLNFVPHGVRRDVVLYAGVLLVGFLGQGSALLSLGPERYYGNGHYDHATYVTTAELLVSEPFAIKMSELGYRPWLVRGIELKEQRITQCVLLGATAVTSGSDSQMAYGAVSAFFIALAGVATATWLRSTGLSRGVAAVAGLAAAWSPALTQLHLDGFFAQAGSLWIYPALAGMLHERGELSRGQKLLAALLVSFLIGIYTEVAIFGVLLCGALVGLSARPIRRRIRDLILILGGALLLNPCYVWRLGQYVAGQWLYARNSTSLAALFPESGTWLGWGHLFFGEGPPGLICLAGLLAIGLGSWGSFARPSRRRHLVLVLGAAALPLLLIRAAAGYSPYVFAKLTMQFVPVWLGAATIGLACLLRPTRRTVTVTIGVGAAVVALVALTALPQQLRVIQPEGRLAVLSSMELVRLRHDVEQAGQRVYLVANDDPLLAEWLCYFGRRSQVVFGRRNLGDRIVPSEVHVFRRWNGPANQLWWLDTSKAGPVQDYEPPPALSITGARQTASGGTGPVYLAGDFLDIVFSRPAGSHGQRTVFFDFIVSPVEPCELDWKQGSERGRPIRLAPGWTRLEFHLPPGRSVSRLYFHPASGVPSINGTAVLYSPSVEVEEGIRGVDPQPLGRVEATSD